MTKAIAITAVWALGILLGIGVMIYGWGLEPQSWWWIIGGGIAGRFLIEIMSFITKQNQ